MGYYDPSGYAMCPPGSKKGRAADSRIEIIDADKGTFRIIDWDSAPNTASLPPKNTIFRVVRKEEYKELLKQKNNKNAALRRLIPWLKSNKMDIHEIHPVNLGGSPTNLLNKKFLFRKTQHNPVTGFWNSITAESKRALK
ncbi:hypothetical protein [Clostridium estertheticum]|uniref:hypothetical protein n=1 Tax=Clostridium estertheticum TaxID=238834 RepID=UPI00227D4DC8|nr:hypothetical protein [Clostridium estertheticum]